MLGTATCPAAGATHTGGLPDLVHTVPAGGVQAGARAGRVASSSCGLSSDPRLCDSYKKTGFALVLPCVLGRGMGSSGEACPVSIPVPVAIPVRVAIPIPSLSNPHPIPPQREAPGCSPGALGGSVCLSLLFTSCKWGSSA